MNDVLSEHTELDQSARDWLHLLVGDWQLLADLSFADLVLWVPTHDGSWVAAAHVRPTTGVGVFVNDVVGSRIDHTRQRTVVQAYDGPQIVRSQATTWRDDLPVREEAIPVVQRGAAIAVLTRHTNLAAMRTPSRLEVTYLATADALARMIAAGEFPNPSAAPAASRRGSPRVGDGVLRLDIAGNVTYASPNAVSAMHRLGQDDQLVGVRLASALGQVLPERGAHDSARAIPLSEGGRRIGAIVLVRDVSELRRRERELLSKDATIREIHHRVKNNLQTVAALLRLQARRLRAPEARAALEEAVRRVGSIAIVHEMLSHAPEEIVDFDDIAGRVAMMAAEVSAPEVRVTPKLSGEFGELPAAVATPLAMILTELLQNALQHGLPHVGREQGLLEVTVVRDKDRLTVTVADSGVGLPEGFDLESATSLGLQI